MGDLKWAISQLRKQIKIRRKAWLNDLFYIYLEDDKVYSNCKDCITEYEFTYMDIISSDWMLYEESTG